MLSPVPRSAAGAAGAEETYRPAELKLAVAGIGISGFVAMLYEVVWTRMLALSLGSSTHAFSLMLATFITGITVGAWVIYRWKRLGRTLDAFGWAELALAASVIVSMFFYHYLPFWFAKLAGLLARRDESYWMYALFQFIMCFGVMFVPTVCLGTTLPLVSRIATRELARTGRSVGVVFAVNTLGTVLGAAVTGLWLLPTLGLARTFAFGAALNAAIALMVVTRAWWMPRPRVLWLAPVWILAAMWLGGGWLDSTWQRVLTAGLWRGTQAPSSMKEFLEEQKRAHMAFYRDGAGSTVNVLEYRGSTETNLSLKVNGKTDASTGGDMVTQIMSGHVPMLIRPESRSVLVVGLGSGVTAAAVALHPPVERIEMVEISPQVVEAAKLFRNANRAVHENPKVRMIVDDAKSHLLATDQVYDAIVSEPSNPWMAGVSGVFTREFFESCRSRLNTNGIMVQWVQVYETSDAAFEMVLATFSSVFPFVGVWSGALDDLLLVGYQTAPAPDLSALERRFQVPEVKADLERVGIKSMPLLLSHELVPYHLGAFLPSLDARIHSDLNPALEYIAQRAFFWQGRATMWRALDDNLWPRPSTLLGRYLADRPLSIEDCRVFLEYHLGNIMFPAQLVQSVALRWRQLEPHSPEAMRHLLRIGQAPSAHELAAARLAPALDQWIQRAGNDARVLRQFVQAGMATYRLERSAYYLPDNTLLLRALERLLEVDPANQRVYRLYLAELAWDEGHDDDCMRLATAALDPDTEKWGPVDYSFDRQAPSAVMTRIIQTHVRAGRMREAWDFCRDIEQKSYVGPNAAFPNVRLEVLYRMLLAVMGNDQLPSN